MTEVKKRLSDTVHIGLKFSCNDTATVMLKDLLRRVAAGQVVVQAVTERSLKNQCDQSLEFTYVDVKGTKH